MAMIVFARHHTQHLASFFVALQKGGLAIPYFCVVRHQDGRLYPFYFNGAPLYLKSGVLCKNLIHT